MRKTLFGVFMLFLCSLLAHGAQKKTSTIKGYSFSLHSLEYFDYNNRFGGRRVLGASDEIPCLKGTIIFKTPLDETPIGLKKTALIQEAFSDRNESMLFDEDADEEKYSENFSNMGRVEFYLRTPLKKESLLTQLKGSVIFKTPVKQNYDKISTIHSLSWFPIPRGKASTIIFKGKRDNFIYVLLKYSRGNASKANMLKLYLLDTETDDKTILWHKASYTDTRGNTFLVFTAKIYFESKEYIYLLINDTDYPITKIIGPPLPNINNVNTFLINRNQTSKYNDPVYMITLPKNRPSKYNWTFVNLNNKYNRFSLKQKKGSHKENPHIIFKEFRKISKKYRINYIGIFQSEKTKQKAVPFQFKDISLDELDEYEE